MHAWGREEDTLVHGKMEKSRQVRQKVYHEKISKFDANTHALSSSTLISHLL